jgi:hypothetical protein
MTAALVESATTAQTLSVEVKTVKIKAFAYAAVKAEEAPEKAPAADAVFADGQMVQCADGTHKFTLEELSPNTEYVIYVAGLLSEADEEGNNQPYEKVLEVKAATGDFTEELTIFDNTGRSFKLHVKPQLTDPANVIKWGTCDIFMHNMNQQPDFDMLTLNDDYYGNYFQGDTTLVFDEAHGYVWSDNMGDYIQYYEAIVPGQPQYLALGEFKYEEDEDVHGRWGWGPGYYMPLMDQEGYMTAYYDSWMTGETPNENDYWTGYHKQIKFQVKGPEALDANLSVDLSGLRANGGPIRINTNGNADRVTVMLLDPMTVEQIMPFLDNNEDYLQWFTTSYIGFMMVGAQTYSILVIDKKKMKLKEAGFPAIVLEQTPKYLRNSKVPVVKAKIGPKVMSLMCEPKIFDLIPIKKEVKAVMNGIYIIDVKGARGGLAERPEKLTFMQKIKAKLSKKEK